METAFWILAGAVVAYLAIDVPAGCQLTAPGFAAPPARALFRVQTDDKSAAAGITHHMLRQPIGTNE